VCRSEARREDYALVAGKSLNRLEPSKLEPTRHHKVSHDRTAIKRLLVDVFLEANKRARNESSSTLMRPTPRS
jgi:hypothetical protein